MAKSRARLGHCGGSDCCRLFRRDDAAHGERKLGWLVTAQHSQSQYSARQLDRGLDSARDLSWSCCTLQKL